MTDDLKAKIVQDVIKSGFADEMKCLNTFLSNGWSTPTSGAYFDRDLKLSREIDVVAHKNPFLGKDHDGWKVFEYRILAEVKKTERPWIIFSDKSKFRAWRGDDHTLDSMFEVNLKRCRATLFKILEESSLAKKIGWRGRGIHEAFKDPNNHSRWYSACVSLVKAIESTGMLNSEHASDAREHFSPEGNFFLQLTRPLIVLSGELVKAEIDERGEIVLEEIHQAVLDFEYHSPEYSLSSHSIDICTAAGLKDYLLFSSDRVEQIAKVVDDAFMGISTTLTKGELS